MLETIREFGLECLDASGEADRTRRAHAEYLARLAEQAEPLLNSGGRGPWLRRFDADQANVRAVLEWAVEHDAAEVGLRLLGALWFWCWLSFREVRRWVTALRALPSASARTLARAKALNGAVIIAWGMAGQLHIILGRSAPCSPAVVALSPLSQNPDGHPVAGTLLTHVGRRARLPFAGSVPVRALLIWRTPSCDSAGQHSRGDAMAIATPLSLTGETLPESLDFERRGMPAPDGVYATVAFTPATGGPVYQILRTTELDAYESPTQTAAVSKLLRQGGATSAGIAQALRAPAPVGDNFAGTSRKAAKLSIGTGKTERFAELRNLIASLTPDARMVAHRPPIAKTAASKRVAEEQRNVRLVGFLYAASHEKDNDFHLIIGRNPASTPDMYMTVEVSGLPPSRSAAFASLNSARASFKTFFGAHLPQFTYDFYHPPIPVVVEGSLFFDITHAVGPHPGPPSLKSRMPTIWEIHPVTSITLGTHH